MNGFNFFLTHSNGLCMVRRSRFGFLVSSILKVMNVMYQNLSTGVSYCDIIQDVCEGYENLLSSAFLCYCFLCCTR